MPPRLTHRPPLARYRGDTAFGRFPVLEKKAWPGLLRLDRKAPEHRPAQVAALRPAHPLEHLP